MNQEEEEGSIYRIQMKVIIPMGFFLYPIVEENFL
jgi:hypothetical protein